MVDIADMKQLGIDTKVLEEAMGMPVVEVNPRKEKGIRAIKAAILSLISEQSPATHLCATDKQPTATEKILHNRLLEQWPHLSAYHAWHIYSAPHQMRWLDEALKKNIQQLVATHQYKSATTQAEDVMNRYQWIHQVVEKAFQHKSSKPKQLITDKADRILLHPIWGNLILFTVLLLLFQSIFWLAAYPMDWIDANYSSFTNWIGSQLPHSWWASLLVDGLLAGIGGIIIFIPQIMILFGLITILEDSGYMARISFLTDRWMRTFGLNGRSIVPLIGGLCSTSHHECTFHSKYQRPTHYPFRNTINELFCSFTCLYHFNCFGDSQ
jgi:ferrous iron transport protein B